jgi:hypothetical protein
MSRESDTALTPEFLRRQVRGMANLELSDQAAGMHELFTGLVTMMNTLQPEGYAEIFPSLTFRPIKE